MNQKTINQISVLLFTVFLFLNASSQVVLPALVSDGMVLQQGDKTDVWGWSAPGEKVEIVFLDSSYTIHANEKGEWKLRLGTLLPGGPYTMELKASNTIVLNDILIGEVWVCSGQSQMDIPMERVSPLYEDEIARAGNIMVHCFTVPRAYNYKEPQARLEGGKWEPVSQDNILSLSAIVYFFSNELNETYNIPVGMIRSSYGGSPIEAWISEDAMEKFPDLQAQTIKFKNDSIIEAIQKQGNENWQKWNAQISADKGYDNPDMPWYNPQTDVSEWPTMNVPGYWADEELGEVNGVVWFRKDITVPASMLGKPVKLNLGRIVDADSAWVNGNYVGNITYQYPPRRYVIPKGILKEGKNTLVVKVISNGGRGGFVPDKPYHLAAEGDTVDITGPWNYKLGVEAEPMQYGPSITFQPSGLFNGMIAPITNYSMRGVLWYQGESNAGHPENYADLSKALITDWRAKWGEGNFPFLYVQLQNYMQSHNIPTDGSWAYLREAQLQTLSVPNTGMASAVDLGEWNDIHPLNKKDVAHRLFLQAQKLAYDDKEVVSSGPLFETMKIAGDSVIISFTETGSGLIAKGGEPLKRFAIAGENKQFEWAEAYISGNRVIVKSKKVENPVAVRYAWSDNPEGANLYNKEGLPASPFRTDTWERTK